MTNEYNETQIRNKYHELTKLLIKRNLSITTMESATGGQIASLITDTEGASAVIKGALITYSNEAKIMAGVSADTIDKYSVYSVQTATEMATVCADRFAADIGIGVTGTMGNVDPANPDASVPGDVYFAIRFGNDIYTHYLKLPCELTRLEYKLTVAEAICDELMMLITSR